MKKLLVAAVFVLAACSETKDTGAAVDSAAMAPVPAVDSSAMMSADTTMRDSMTMADTTMARDTAPKM